MTFLEDLKDWREPRTGAVSCEYKPNDYSCDNGIDFTAAAILVARRVGEDITGFNIMCLQYETREVGELMRHPDATTSMSWDDHTSAAAISPFMAKRILQYGQNNKWNWDNKTKKLWRFPIFIPTVLASANGKINILWQAWGSIAYIYNCFEKYDETSGKKNLWIAQEALYGKGLLITASIKLWRFVMSKRYKRGMKEVFEKYFFPKQGVEHPITKYAPNDFK